MSGSDRPRIPWPEYLAMHIREIGLAALLLVVLLLAWQFVELPGGTELTGRVSSGGRSVVYGTVSVVASDDRVYSAPIGPDGTYRITSLPPGPVRVSVSSPNPRSVVDQMPAGDDAARPAAAPAPRPAAAAPAGKQSDAKDAATENVTVAAPNGTAPPFPAPLPQQQPQQQGWFRIPGRYASPTTSGIRTKVRDGRTPLDLKLD